MNFPHRLLFVAAAAGLAALLAACGGDSDSATVSIRDRAELEVYDNEHTTSEQIHLAGNQSADYTVLPPYGEEHSPIPLSCGIYSSTPLFEMVVHAMEHGAVALWYTPAALDEGELAQLTDITTEQLEDSKYVIQAPYAALGYPLMLVAWGARLPLDSVEAAAIDEFFDEFYDLGPEPVRAGGCPTAS